MKYEGNINDIMKVIEHIKIDYEINNTEIAKSMGKSKQTVSNLLNGQTGNITLNTLVALCNAVGCELHIDIKRKD
ncbi:helix-turn-helix domain-containing protein [Lacrimispora sp.]|uniref:helix-turn-helix domain-containing protein n=1 Tax=Lacrimispora sp. TaxID=2719234 RepID=UPI0028A7B173|nr:helix-turn-helix transcriptional regulator [Lacrimispora sp.]